MLGWRRRLSTQPMGAKAIRLVCKPLEINRLPSSCCTSSAPPPQVESSPLLICSWLIFNASYSVVCISGLYLCRCVFWLQPRMHQNTMRSAEAEMVARPWADKHKSPAAVSPMTAKRAGVFAPPTAEKVKSTAFLSVGACDGASRGLSVQV